MAKRDVLEEKLARLRGLGEGPFSPEVCMSLGKALGDSHSAVVAEAASIVARSGLEELGEALEEALARFLSPESPADKGCMAKTALVDALCRLELGRPELFLRGLRHVQMEPVWGGQADTAASLRGLCALALAQQNWPGVFYELTPLLVDPEKETRRHCVRALALTGRTEAELLLRLKALCGDAEAEIVAECLSALMQLSSCGSLEFVAGFLESPQPAIRESAALAIGESRLEEGFSLLRNCWEENLSPQMRSVLLLPIALVRSEESFVFLLHVLESAASAMARLTLNALKIYRHEKERMLQVEKTLKRRGDKALVRVFKEELK